MSAPAQPSPEVVRDALDHMNRSIEKAAAAEDHNGKRRKPKSDHPDIPGMQYLGTQTSDRHFHPAD
jgi:hypothetical protein